MSKQVFNAQKLDNAFYFYGFGWSYYYGFGYFDVQKNKC
jgi:CRISPR/Cas system endoribonuclease Cas6 (RAMP superfamily)